MSYFNAANEVAHETVYGRHYQNDEPCERPEGITEHNGVLQGELHRLGAVIDLTGKPVNHETWMELANKLHELQAIQLQAIRT